MTYEELYLYVNNAYVQAYQNNLYGTEIVIKKEDYFSLLEICAEFDIRCFPFTLGFNRILYEEPARQGCRLDWERKRVFGP